jgi:hypothetical protein
VLRLSLACCRTHPYLAQLHADVQRRAAGPDDAARHRQVGVKRQPAGERDSVHRSGDQQRRPRLRLAVIAAGMGKSLPRHAMLYMHRQLGCNRATIAGCVDSKWFDQQHGSVLDDGTMQRAHQLKAV